MIEPYPQVRSNRLSGDEDEWRVLVKWEREAPTAIYTIQQALQQAEALQQAHEHEVARRIREAAARAPRH